MKVRVFDVETDGLLNSLTKIHNLCYTEDGQEYHYTTDYTTMKKWLKEPDVTWVGHNIVMFDFEAVKKVLNVDLSYKNAIDTLSISWALYADRPKHGLASWGDDVGIKKVFVDEGQWESGDPELMKSRVEEDVKINWKVWKLMDKRLTEIYGDDTSGKERYLRFLSFKMFMLQQQEANPLRIDLEKAQAHYDELQQVVEDKLVELTEVMPKRPIEHTAPKVYRKQDGTLSVHGVKWEEKLKQYNQPSGTTRFFEYENGNPNSDPQLKEWLFSLGWEPCTNKFQRNKLTGDEKQIPQVRYFSQNDSRKGELTDSVKALVKVTPELQALDGLTVAKHRMKIFEAFLKHSDEDGNIVAGAGGFTNTMRMKHRLPIVNLPKAVSSVPWGKEIRGCIKAQEGKVLCGSDVSSLEDMTKRHLIYDLDPEFVENMNTPGYDPHCAISVQAGKMTEEQYEFFKQYKAEGYIKDHELSGKEQEDLFHQLTEERQKAKTVSYSAVYGIGSPKLARELQVTEKEAQKLLDAYWAVNWSVKKVAEQQYVKTLKDGTSWLKSPLSGFYHQLRYEKDRWSTTNQSSGDYCFSLWVSKIIQRGYKLSLNYHDEVLLQVNPEDKEQTEKDLHECMQEVNEVLKLNINIGAEVKFGDDYSSVH